MTWHFFLPLLCAAVGLSSGACRKRDSEPASNPTATAAKSASTPEPAPAPADGTFPAKHAAAAMGPFQRDLDGNSPDGHLRALDAALTFWMASGRPFPKDLNELVTAKLITRVPAPPSGKRYVLDAATQQVRLAP